MTWTKKYIFYSTHALADHGVFLFFFLKKYFWKNTHGLTSPQVVSYKTCLDCSHDVFLPIYQFYFGKIHRLHIPWSPYRVLSYTYNHFFHVILALLETGKTPFLWNTLEDYFLCQTWTSKRTRDPVGSGLKCTKRLKTINKCSFLVSSSFYSCFIGRFFIIPFYNDMSPTCQVQKKRTQT